MIELISEAGGAITLLALLIDTMDMGAGGDDMRGGSIDDMEVGAAVDVAEAEAAFGIVEMGAAVVWVGVSEGAGVCVVASKDAAAVSGAVSFVRGILVEETDHSRESGCEGAAKKHKHTYLVDLAIS